MSDQKIDSASIGEGIAIAGCAIGAGLLLGLMLSGDPRLNLDSEARTLAKGFEVGLARAACIEANREWAYDKCKMKK